MKLTCKRIAGHGWHVAEGDHGGDDSPVSFEGGDHGSYGLSSSGGDYGSEDGHSGY